MTNIVDVNRAKCFKWAFLLARKLGRRDLTIAASRSGGSLRFEYRAGDASVTLSLGPHNADVIVAPRGAADLSDAGHRELRTMDVLPRLIGALELGTAPPIDVRARSDAEASRFAAAWRVLGLFAVRRTELPVFEASSGGNLAKDPEPFLPWSVPGRRVGDLLFLDSGLILHRRGAIAEATELQPAERPDAEWFVAMDRFHDEGIPPQRTFCAFVDATGSAHALFSSHLSNEVVFAGAGRLRRVDVREARVLEPIIPFMAQSAVMWEDGGASYVVDETGSAWRWPPEPDPRPIASPIRAPTSSTWQPQPLLAAQADRLAFAARERVGEDLRFFLVHGPPRTQAGWSDLATTTLQPSENAVAVCLAADRIAVMCSSSIIVVHDLRTGDHYCIGHSNIGAHPSRGAVDAEGRLAAVFADEFALVDLDARREIGTWRVAPRSSTKQCPIDGAFAPDGRHLVLATASGVIAFDLVARTLRAVAPTPLQWPARISFSPDAKWCAVTSATRSIVLDWNRIRGAITRFPVVADELCAARPQ